MLELSMNLCNMMGSVDSIETFGLVDGPGIRTVVFLNGCMLRCKFCHNPEMWKLRDKNYSVDDIVKKVLRSKPYFKNKGGVTFSGGEPLLQYDFLVECCKELKKNDIHIAIDTAGIGNGDYTELLKSIDMVLLDIKHIDKDGYIDITQMDKISEFFNFVNQLNNSNVDVWIRQVVVPGIHDNDGYMSNLVTFINKYIKNVKRIDFLPYHRLGREKYIAAGLEYPYEGKNDMDKTRCDELFNKYFKDFIEK